MSTLSEIEEAIEQLLPVKFNELRQWIERRSKSPQMVANPQHSWPVPPPQVERTELDRIEAEIETEFPTLSR